MIKRTEFPIKYPITFLLVFLIFLMPVAVAQEISPEGESPEVVPEEADVEVADESIGEGDILEEELVGVPVLVYLQRSVVPANPVSDAERFAVSPNTGGAIYNYPIILPPGTHGLQPEVNIRYSNQNPKQKQSILGTGWGLSQTYIQRDANYTFNNSADDYFFLSLNGNVYELAYSSDGKYHTDPESFLSIENISGSGNENGEYWLVRTKDGTSYRLGFNNDSELVSNLYDYTVKWSIDKIFDTYNNSVFYNYTENPNVNDNGTVYPDTIEYNNDRERKVKFTFEGSNRPDLKDFYENGNRVKYSRRLSEIKIFEGEGVIDRYVFNYSELDSYSLSFLTDITRYGEDNSSLPSVSFDYKPLNIGWDGGSFPLPSSLPGADEGHRFEDFNRDGLTDFIHSYCDEEEHEECEYGINIDYQVWINNGSSLVADTTPGWNYTFYFTLGHYDTGARFSDINGDGFSDILYSSAGNQSVWINNGTNWNKDTSWRIPVNFTEGIYEEFEDLSARLVEINGDGLVDIVYGNEVQQKKLAFINNGTGWVKDDKWAPPEYLVWEDGGLLNVDRQVRFADLNGDGLTDLVATDSNRLWYNTGDGWSHDTTFFPPVLGDWRFFLGVTGSTAGDGGHRLFDADGDGLVDIVSAKVDYKDREASLNKGDGWQYNDTWISPAYFAKKDGRDEGVRLGDINGDGVTDILGDSASARLNKAVGAYQLTQIKNEQGGTILIDYIPSTKLDNTGEDNISDMGFSLWLVSNVTKDNNMSGEQNVNQVTYYNYSGGMYDYEGREFRGFAYSSERIGDRITEHWFHQGEGLKNHEYRTEISDLQDNPYKKTEQTWNATENEGYYVVLLQESSDFTYDGSPSNPRIMNTSFVYDNFGNVVEVHYKGDVEVADDDKYERFNYLNNSEKWIVDKLENYSLLDSNNSVVREALYSYDGFAYGVAPVNGSLTREEHVLIGGTNPVNLYSYDGFGNLVNQTDSNGNSNLYVFGVRDTTYTFADTIIDAKGGETNYEYDLGRGNVIWQEDSNGFVTNSSYDGFGRKVKEVMPYDDESYPTIEYEYLNDGLAPEVVKTMRREVQGGGTYDEYAFSDGFGNVVQDKKEGENAQQIVTDIFYDEFNRIKRQSNLYFVSFFENYSAPNLSVAFVNYSYDILDRTIKVVNPDSTFNTANYTHWNITFVDENGNRIDHVQNAYGKIVQINEYNGGEVYVTSYDYDSADNLVGITDDLENNWSYVYDSLGRKVSSIDPDTGISNYSYDGVGNLVSQTTGGGNLVSGDGYFREYDDFGRLVRIYNGSDNSSLIEAYTYDGNGERIKTYNAVRNETTYTPFKEFTMIINESGQFNYTYVYDGNDVLVSRIEEGGSRRYYHADHLGSTTLITKANGNLEENTFYLPYGGVDSGGEADSKLYEGKEFSSDANHYYYGARYYDPDKAMFVQPDTIIPDVYDPQQLNIYAFERRNPYSYTDPTGNEIVTAAVVYTIIETVIDIASFGYSVYVIVKDPGVVNVLAVGADALDLAYGPLSNPGPSGPLVRNGADLAESLSIKTENKLFGQVVTETANDLENSLTSDNNQNKIIMSPRSRGTIFQDIKKPQSVNLRGSNNLFNYYNLYQSISSDNGKYSNQGNQQQREGGGSLPPWCGCGCSMSCK